MHDVLLKHLTQVSCQKDKNGASVRSCAILDADALLCLEGRGRGEKLEGVRKAGAMICAKHSEMPALAGRISLSLGEGSGPWAGYQEMRICSFYLTNY